MSSNESYNEESRRFSIPGHYADPDMLIVGKHLTEAEDRSHFAMRCMFSVPLVLGCDLTALKAETLELITNPELIPVDKNAHIIVYCFGGRRGSHAYHELTKMLYNNVYNLGNMYDTSDLPDEREY